MVAVFSCGAPAMVVYGWIEKAPDGGEQYVIVLGKPPIWNARAAVRAHLAGS